MVTLGICSLFSFVPYFLLLWISVSQKGSALCSVLPPTACSIFTCMHAYTHCTPSPCLVKMVVFDRHYCKGKLAKQPEIWKLRRDIWGTEYQAVNNDHLKIYRITDKSDSMKSRGVWPELGRCPENGGSMDLSDHPDRTRTYRTYLRRRQCDNVAFAQGCPNMPPACFLRMGWHFKSNSSAPNSPRPPPNFTEKKKFICRKNWGFFLYANSDLKPFTF